MGNIAHMGRSLMQGPMPRVWKKAFVCKALSVVRKCCVRGCIIWTLGEEEHRLNSVPVLYLVCMLCVCAEDVLGERGVVD